MKYLIVGDMHLRAKTPRCRTEKDFTALCLGKLKQCIDIAKENRACILQPGDFFDRAQPAGSLVVKLLELLESEEAYDIHTIHGQHDLLHHNIEAAQGSELRKMEAVSLLHLGNATGWVSVQGIDFGQPIPEPVDAPFNILMVHMMIGDKPLWPGHELTAPEAFMDKHPGFDLYVIGDYHYPFTVQHNGAWAINAGVMIRLTASERDMAHRPKVVLFDTETGPEDIYLDVTPASEAFDLSKKAVVRDNAKLEELVKKLKKSGEVGVDFTANLVQYIEDNNVSDEVREILMTALEGVKK